MSAPRDPELVDGRRFRELRDELAELVRAYAPEWRLDASTAGADAALVAAFAHLSELLTVRLDRASRRNQLVFLSDLGAKLVNALPARVPVRFVCAPGTERQVRVPARTEVAGQGRLDGRDERVPFETVEDLFAVPEGVKELVGVDPERDRICRPPLGFLDGKSVRVVYAVAALAAVGSKRITLAHVEGLAAGQHLRLGCAPGAQQVRIEKLEGSAVYVHAALERDLEQGAKIESVGEFAPFDGIDVQEHVWYVGDSALLRLEEPATIVMTARLERSLGSRRVVWEALVKDPPDAQEPRWVELERAAPESDPLAAVRLFTSARLEQAELNGVKTFWIRCRLERHEQSPGLSPTSELPLLRDVRIGVTSGHAQDSDRPLLPELAFANTTQVDPNALGGALPFGEVPRLYDAFYVASSEAFSKAGAHVTLNVESQLELAPPAALLVDGVPRVYHAGSDGKLLEGRYVEATAKFEWTPQNAPLVYPGTNVAAAQLAGRREVFAWGRRTQEAGLYRSVVDGASGTGDWTRLGPPFADLALAGQVSVTLLDGGELGARTILHNVSRDGAWSRHVVAPNGTVTSKPLKTSTATSPPVVASDGTGIVVVGKEIWSASEAGDPLELARGEFEADARFAVDARLAAGEWRVAAIDTVGQLWIGSGAALATLEWVAVPFIDPGVKLASRPTVRVETFSLGDVRTIRDVRVFVRSSSGGLYEWRAPVGGPARWITHTFVPGLSSALSIVTPGDPDALAARALVRTIGSGVTLLKLDGTVEGRTPKLEKFGLVLDSLPAELIENTLLVDRNELIAVNGVVEKLDLVELEAKPSHVKQDDTARFVKEVGEAFKLTDFDAAARTFTLDKIDKTTATNSVLELFDGASPPRRFVVTIDSIDVDRKAMFSLAFEEPLPSKLTKYIATSGAYAATVAVDARRLVRLGDLKGVDDRDLVASDLELGPKPHPISHVLVMRGDVNTGWLETQSPLEPHPPFNMRYALAVAALTSLARSETDPPADAIRLAWEYWNGSGWVALDPRSVAEGGDAFVDGTDNLQVGGRVTFDVPAKLAPTDVVGQTKHWIRVRFVGGSFVRESFVVRSTKEPKVRAEVSSTDEKVDVQRVVPERTGPGAPRLTRLEIEYALDSQPPQHVLTFNNLQWRDQTDAARPGNDGFPPFEALEVTQRAIYAGMHAPFETSLTLFAHVAEWDGARTRFTWETLARGEWSSTPANDDSGDLTRPGVLRFSPPLRVEHETRFGTSAAWLRGVEAPATGSDAAADATADPRRRVVFLALHPNTVWAEQVRTIRDEVLGSSNGERDQVLELRFKPVQGEIELTVDEIVHHEELEALREAGAVARGSDAQPQRVTWTRVDDLARSPADARHYELDRALGHVRFGDDVHGRVPPLGARNLRVASYRTGGGDVEAPVGTITQLVGAVAGIAEVTNPLPAGGGSAVATPEASARSASAALEHSDRAVTDEDFERVAIELGGRPARARCLVDHAAIHTGAETSWVRVALLPRAADRVPRPGLALREALSERLRSRAHGELGPGCRIDVVAPRFVELEVRTALVVRTVAEAARVDEEARRALATFLHPVTGGRWKDGWDFGRAPQRSDVLALLHRVSGVVTVASLELVFVRGDADSQDDAELAADEIVVSRERHDVSVRVQKAGES